MLCINVYIPQSNSKASLEDKTWDTLESVIEALIIQFPSFHFILGGDTRIDMGVSVISASSKTNITMQAPPLAFRSKDRGINKYKIKFLDLLAGNNLFALNDLDVTYLDVTGGSFTYPTTLRASIIDYFAISPDLLNWVLKFEVIRLPPK